MPRENNVEDANLFSKIRVHQIHPANDSDARLKANVSLVVTNAIMLTGLRVIQGKHGLFVSMPLRKDRLTGEYSDIAFPISKEIREKMTEAILAAYAEATNAKEVV
jgi:stage V sporulation protein G